MENAWGLTWQQWTTCASHSPIWCLWRSLLTPSALNLYAPSELCLTQFSSYYSRPCRGRRWHFLSPGFQIESQNRVSGSTLHTTVKTCSKFFPPGPSDGWLLWPFAFAFGGSQPALCPSPHRLRTSRTSYALTLSFEEVKHSFPLDESLLSLSSLKWQAHSLLLSLFLCFLVNNDRN